MKTDRLMNDKETKMSVNKQELNSYTSFFSKKTSEKR